MSGTGGGSGGYGARPGRATLLAIAHGSTDPRAAATTADLIDEVRQRAAHSGLGALATATAYLGHQVPSPVQALRDLRAAGTRHVVALPLLLTDAYHSRIDIPAVLRAARASLPGMLIRYARPLGPHPLLIEAMEGRLREAGVRIGDARTAVVLAAAGSSDPAARSAIAMLAGNWRAARGWLDVVPAFASAAPPTPAAAVKALRRRGAARVVVASYLLAPGIFADVVRESSLAAGAATVSGVLGAAPELAELVVRRHATAIDGPPRTLLASIARQGNRVAGASGIGGRERAGMRMGGTSSSRLAVQS